jgi:hypothetical protein
VLDGLKDAGHVAHPAMITESPGLCQ